ncbi:MAG: hypothetical protein D4R77_07785 [Planctomycetaceae bacterium]|nr:MAG: hypothetical protein D4R77_07785 [Planctomycetaceae bacterium]
MPCPTFQIMGHLRGVHQSTQPASFSESSSSSFYRCEKLPIFPKNPSSSRGILADFTEETSKPL